MKIAQSLSDEQIAALRSHKVAVELRVRDGGHSWIYWQTALPDILTYVSIGFME